MMEPHSGPLKRALGVWDLTAIGIGGIIGAGIFVSTRHCAGPPIDRLGYDHH